MLAYILVALIYNYTEAGFRMLNYIWGFLVLLIMMAGYILEHAESVQTSGTAKERVAGGWFGSPDGTPRAEVSVRAGAFG